ncbi:MAG TPA: hypothetical protein PLO61_04725 [Fimbriimonadaceae bacterium]|nr:hypothetical protein [Fimbriimonadaceae bacterium]HRJ32524.1 hypothetical protein [Fimbriimonadaceae bacterium]
MSLAMKILLFPVAALLSVVMFVMLILFCLTGVGFVVLISLGVFSNTQVALKKYPFIAYYFDIMDNPYIMLGDKRLPAESSGAA